MTKERKRMHALLWIVLVAACRSGMTNVKIAKSPNMGVPQDVVLVSRFYAPSAKARAEQVASMWPRAALAKFRCPGKGVCASVPWACTDRGGSTSRCRHGYCALGQFVVIHVKFACFNLFEYFPNALHIYDPVDKRLPQPVPLQIATPVDRSRAPSRSRHAAVDDSAEWDRLANFSGVLALSSAHRKQATGYSQFKNRRSSIPSLRGVLFTHSVGHDSYR